MFLPHQLRTVRVGAVLAALFVFGCASTEEKGSAAATTDSAAHAPPEQNATALNGQGEHPLRILLSTDEHGWLEPFMDRPAGVRRGGMIELADAWARNESDAPQTTLRLSGGDMWTGPYESTVLEGRPMVDAFNVLGYEAAAIGNHEFDFGVRVLNARAQQAKFPLLAANVTENATGQRPPWAKPYQLFTKGNLVVGVVGLANLDTPLTTDKRHIVGLSFAPYAETLQSVLPEAKAAGADVLIVLIHDNVGEVMKLGPLFRQYGVNMIGAGHAHHSKRYIDDGGTPNDASDDLLICNAGPYMRTYCRFDATYRGAKLAGATMDIVSVERPLDARVEAPSSALMSILKRAHAEVDAIGAEVLVQSERPLLRSDGSLGQFIVDTWLEALPYASVSITNAGGLRQDLAAGPLRVRDIASALPFNNYLVVVDISGAQLREALANPESVVGGITVTYRDVGGKRVIVSATDHHGQPIADDKQYQVAINDFMYRGGDGYQFLTYDGEPEETAVDWREPLLRRLRTLRDEKKPLRVTPDDRMKKVP